ncbi:MAG: metabolite traffic protein EboE [Kiritimatiellia bacterium]
MYCLNIHPGETFSEAIAALRGPVAAVKRAVSPDAPYAVGLRLGSRAAQEAILPARLAELKQTLDGAGLQVCHVNGFPYGQFHRTAVKTRVYVPDWSSRLRLEYTLDLARILAAIMPAGERHATISTVPFGYRGNVRAHDCLNLLDEAEARLGDLEAQTGKNIVLAFEPEPDCLAGSVAEALALLPPARHRTILVDTCHAAVVGEKPAACLAQIVRAGFTPRRVQISAAIVADSSRAGALARIANSTYLHQTRIYTRSGEPVAAFPDLSADALDCLRRNRDLIAKVHCHVPLDWRGDGHFRSSADEITDEFLAACRNSRTAMEIETYTYEILPETLRPPSVEKGIVAEELWLKTRVQSLPAR